MPKIELNRPIAEWAQLLEPKYRYIFIRGGRSCVHGDTLIDTPSGAVKIKDFSGGLVYSYKNGKTIATPAFPSEVFDKDHLYKVCFSNGSEIICTAAHRFLTNRGYVSLNNLSGEDHILCETSFASLFPLLSSLGLCPSRFLLGVRRCLKKPLDFLWNCLLYRRQCDPQPLLVSNNVLAFSPLRGDVRRHSCRALSRSGGLGWICTYSPSYISRRLSKCFFPLSPSSQSYGGLESRSASQSSARLLGSSLFSLLSRVKISPAYKSNRQQSRRSGFLPLKYLGKSLKTTHQSFSFFFRGISSLFHPYSNLSVSSVTYYGHREYYDIHVPVYNNYLSGGVVNHNSGKSHEVAGYLAERSFTEKDLRIVGLREVQKSIKRSSRQLVEDKLRDYGLVEYYKPIEAEIRKTIEGDDGLFMFQGMNDLTADNVKSLERFKISWFEEAQNASFNTLRTLRPTIARVEGSQQIYTWNPKLPTDPIDELCARLQNEPDVLVLHINYEQNPFLSDSALKEIDLERKSPDFAHIYLGEYDESFQGHYYAKLIQQARDGGRICEVPQKNGVGVISAWDLGMRDATAIWVAQQVGLQWRIIDYYENNFEDLPHYVEWMKDRGYDKGKVFLPHDGSHERLGMQGSIKSQLRDMGLSNIVTLSNATVDSGIASAKTLLAECYFDKDKCAEGLSALSHYHAKLDEVKNVYKEVHDWSSHGADAFRYLAQAIIRDEAGRSRPKPAVRRVVHHGGWMAS